MARELTIEALEQHINDVRTMVRDNKIPISREMFDNMPPELKQELTQYYIPSDYLEE